MPNFWLVQRIDYSPPEKYAKLNLSSNPFGYGRLGNYELDYMGSAEFEWGAIPDSYNAFRKANKKKDGLSIVDHTYNHHNLRFLFITKDSDPFDTFTEWVKSGCEGKEPAYGLARRLKGTQSQWDHTAVWWSLTDNIMWAFVENDGTCHLNQLLDSIKDVTPQLRDSRQAKVKTPGSTKNLE